MVEQERLVRSEVVASTAAAGNSHELAIAGMTCASCVRRVERALSKVPGVAAASVNLATERARVIADGGPLDTPTLIAAVERAGYQATPVEVLREASAEADPYAADKRDSERTTEIVGLRNRALVSLVVGVVMMSVMATSATSSAAVLDPFLLIAATVVQVWAGGRFYRAAWAAARHGAANMNTLIVAGTSMAYGYSAFVTLWPSQAQQWGFPHQTYFESSVIIVALVLLGRWLEARARGRTGVAIQALMRLQSRTARVVRGVRDLDVPIEQVRVGDLIRVRPGERLPVDGVVVDGFSVVDQSPITGESLPVEKEIGATVIAGTLNGNGGFVFRAERVGRDTMLAQIMRLVEDAQGSKAPIQRTADAVAARFVPAILLLAVLTFAIWLAVGPNPRLTHALTAAVAVLIIACPCALGLATPIAIMVGTGKAAQLGILIRSGESLERARSIDTIVLDKTGTLTSGTPSVLRVIPSGELEAAVVLRLAASVETGSEHPLGEAVVSHVRALGLQVPLAQDFTSATGRGVSAVVDGHFVAVGNRRWLDGLGVAPGSLAHVAMDLDAAGATPMFVAIDGCEAGVIVVADAVRAEARTVVSDLRRLGLEVWMLTGDSERTAQAIAGELGIDRVQAEVLPEEKDARVRALQAEGRTVAMVGDGINDAPALASADLGIAIGTGTDVAIAASDITLIGNDLRSIPTAIALSRRTVLTIRRGLFWAFAYNLLLIPIAMGVLYPLFHLQLSPMLAAAAMGMSSVSVVMNALRLRSFRAPVFAAKIPAAKLAGRVSETLSRS